MIRRIHQDVVNVVLSKKLDEQGLPNHALPRDGDIPDIYALVRGIRVIIEGMFEGEEQKLDGQLRGRLIDGLCDLSLGILYPMSLVTSVTGPPPSVREVEDRLRTTTMKCIALALGSGGIRILPTPGKYSVAQIPALVNDLAIQASPEHDIESAIEDVREAIGSFVREMESLPNHDAIEKEIREILGLE